MSHPTSAMSPVGPVGVMSHPTSVMSPVGPVAVGVMSPVSTDRARQCDESCQCAGRTALAPVCVVTTLMIGTQSFLLSDSVYCNLQNPTR